MMEQRLVNIRRLVSAYSAGDFSRRISLSDNLDETDAVISALHMLGEELSALTVTRDYFTDLFNAMSEMALVVTPKGEIEQMNKAVTEQLGYARSGLIGRPVDLLAGDEGRSLARQIRKEPGPDGVVRIWERSFLTATGEVLPVEIVVRPLSGPGARGRGPVLLTAKDMGPRQAAENRLLRAVIDAQEQERARLARDLHDGLGQQLSAIKFLVSTVVKECDMPDLRAKLLAANESLFEVLAQTRRLCHNLMPSSLEDFGLIEAVRDLGAQLEEARVMRVSIGVGRDLPDMSRALQIDVYRVIQEFFANAIRHGEATRVQVHFSGDDGALEVRLRDNGKGFDTVAVQAKGMGLRNMHSRIRSHQGQFLLRSEPGRGTGVRIRIRENESY